MRSQEILSLKQRFNNLLVSLNVSEKELQSLKESGQCPRVKALTPSKF